MQGGFETLIEFDRFLLETVDKTLRYCLGDGNAEIIYQYMEQRGIQRNEIPAKLEKFSIELRNIMGTDRRQILGYARILEETIIETLCIRMKVKFDDPKFASFSNYVKKLEEIYVNQKCGTNMSLCVLSDEFCSKQIEATTIGGEKR